MHSPFQGRDGCKQPHWLGGRAGIGFKGEARTVSLIDYRQSGGSRL